MVLLLPHVFSLICILDYVYSTRELGLFSKVLVSECEVRCASVGITNNILAFFFFLFTLNNETSALTDDTFK